MKNLKKSYFTFVLCFLLLLGNSFSVFGSQQPYHELFEQAAQKNSSIDAPIDNLNQYRYNFKNGKELFTKEDATLLKSFDFGKPVTVTVKKEIERKDAQAEIEWLFRLLRTQYGLYTWFGGDEVFEKAKQEILNQLDGKGTIPTTEYSNILTKELSFIEDSHFGINGNYFYPNIILYSNEEKPFFQKDGNFYSDETYTTKVISIEEQSPENYIKKAIGQDGEITYYLYAMEKEQTMIYKKIQYENGTKETISLKPAKYINGLNKEKTTQYILKSENSYTIPYCVFNLFSFYNSNEKSYQTIINTAEKIKQYPLSVIDISANGGGNMQIGLDWFEAYTNQKAQSNFCMLRIKPQGAWKEAIYPNDFEEYEQAMEDFGLTVDGDYYISTPQKQFVKNKNSAIILLTSRNTQSAAEIFTDTIKNMENVLTVGTNTGGVMINAANYGYALPYSGMYFQFGECFNYWNPNYFKEGYGMEPDIYLTGINLEKRLELFINHYLSE